MTLKAPETNMAVFSLQSFPTESLGWESRTHWKAENSGFVFPPPLQFGIILLINCKIDRNCSQVNVVKWYHYANMKSEGFGFWLSQMFICKCVFLYFVNVRSTEGVEHMKLAAWCPCCKKKKRMGLDFPFLCSLWSSGEKGDIFVNSHCATSPQFKNAIEKTSQSVDL